MIEGLPGLLSGNFDISNPQTMGLLSAAAELIDAGQPSKKKISFGEALARGLSKGISGYSMGKKSSPSLDFLDKIQKSSLGSESLGGGGLGGLVSAAQPDAKYGVGDTSFLSSLLRLFQ